MPEWLLAFLPGLVGALVGAGVAFGLLKGAMMSQESRISKLEDRADTHVTEREFSQLQRYIEKCFDL